MKILKIFGIVVGIHVFALILIFANPGCSSTTKPPPTPADTVAAAETPPLTLPLTAPTHSATPTPAPMPASSAAAPVMFNPDAPASASNASRYNPTRPGTPVAGALVVEPVADVVPATTYAVKSGDSLWSIAKKHHLSVADLAAANNLPVGAVLRLNQKLLIPGKATSPVANSTAAVKVGAAPDAKSADAAAAAAAARASGEIVKHVVKSGETLEKIARVYGVKQGDIAVANNIADPAKIKLGAELIIPGWQPPKGKAGKNATKAGGAAKAGETKVEAPATAPAVPVIPIFDSPISPAPRP